MFCVLKFFGGVMLYKQIKKLRKEKNWSQQKLAEKTGLSYNAITKLEQNIAQHPTVQTVSKLADAFEISIDELLERNIKNKQSD